MCGCECFIYSKIINSSLLSWHDHYHKKLKDQIQNSQNRRSGEKSNRVYESYKIQSFHIGVIFTSKHLIWQRQQYVRIHNQIMHFHTGNVSFNFVWNVQTLIFLTRKQIINITTKFHVYHLIARCSTHGRLPLNKKRVTSVNMILIMNNPQNIYTRKELGMMETTIYNFYTSFYILEIQNLTFHIPHVKILGKNHYGNSRWTTFKHSE